MSYKYCAFALLFFTVCYGRPQHNHHRESTTGIFSTDVGTQRMTGSTITPVLQHSFDYDHSNFAWFAVLPIGLFIFTVCCLICCKLRLKRNQDQEEVLTIHPPPPQPAYGMIIEQHAPPPMQQTDLPPPYHTQPVVPPPYDTQPVWGRSAPQQYFDPTAPPPPHQQFPTSYTNPNYVQPPVNAEYGQEKY